MNFILDSIFELISKILDRFLSSKLALNRYVEILEFLRPHQIDHPDFNLVRVGSKFDGGYLVPEKKYLESKILFSCGIGSNNDFELDFSKNGEVYQFDHTIKNPPHVGNNLNFQKLEVSTLDSNNRISLDSILNPHKQELINSLLKIDIEENEWLVLQTSELIKNLGVVILELHNLHKAVIGINANRRLKLLKMLNSNFITIHTHGNNCCGFFEGINWRLPKVVEVILVNRILIKEKFTKPMRKHLPISLDAPNVADRPDLFLGDLWSTKGIGI